MMKKLAPFLILSLLAASPFAYGDSNNGCSTPDHQFSCAGVMFKDQGCSAQCDSNTAYASCSQGSCQQIANYSPTLELCKGDGIGSEDCIKDRDGLVYIVQHNQCGCEADD